MAAPTTTGRLSLVATPIGNLEDMTFRAVRVLREADLIAAEDTRRARVLLDHFGVDRPLTSYHQHNEHWKTAQLLGQVRAGKKVAVLSDAGTPSLSDPGYLLVRDAVAAGLEPEIIPGVSALAYAVTACGFPVTEFIFAGFLPAKGARRRRLLVELLAKAPTVFLFESPFRVGKLLEEIVAELGGDTRVALLREATKLHEEHLRGSAADVLERHRDRHWKGEFTVAITRPGPVSAPDATAAAGENPGATRPAAPTGALDGTAATDILTGINSGKPNQVGAAHAAELAP